MLAMPEGTIINPHTVPFNRIDVEIFIHQTSANSAYHALLPFLVLCHLTLILWGNLILHLIIWGKTTFFYLAKNKRLTQKTSEIGADFMGKTTNYMGNFRAQFPLAILLSDIWFPYLCLPSSGPPSIPVWSSYTSLYLLTTNQADNPCKFYE